MRHIEIVFGLFGVLLVTWSFAGHMEAAPVPAGAAPRVVAFDIVAKRFAFSPERIEVSRGDHVKLTIRSADGVHGFAIKKLKVETSVPKGGAPVALEFDAAQAGQFPITCSEWCGRGHSEMKALLVVNESGAGK
jgi:cytochrome c oxidase subunit II